MILCCTLYDSNLRPSAQSDVIHPGGNQQHFSTQQVLFNASLITYFHLNVKCRALIKHLHASPKCLTMAFHSPIHTHTHTPMGVYLVCVGKQVKKKKGKIQVGKFLYIVVGKLWSSIVCDMEPLNTRIVKLVKKTKQFYVKLSVKKSSFWRINTQFRKNECGKDRLRELVAGFTKTGSTISTHPHTFKSILLLFTQSVCTLATSASSSLCKLYILYILYILFIYMLF